MKALSACALRASLLLILLLLVGAAATLLLASERIHDLPQGVIDSIDRPASTNNNPVLFKVDRGEDAQGIGKRLEQQGLIRSATLFRLLASYYGVSSQLSAGEYELRPNMTTTEIISVLHQGLVKTMVLTIPEGWRTTQIADLVSKNGIFNRDDFLKAVQEGTYNYDFLPDKSSGGSLEGYLFPDTYHIPPSFSPSDLVDYMLKDFNQRVTPAMRSKAAANGLSLQDAITLASIVEREAVVASERPVIAGVYLNRLKLGMPLQADPTVQYALANDPDNVAKWGFWKVGLTVADLEVISPYNTYHNTGLPPGPICNPGLASIQAVLEPTTTDYLYFVAKNDGSHAFAKTLDEHERNIQLYSK